ncbi:MAG: CpsD/CapB family tyrosine-protein kinase [Acidobacteria bacterium]|nr:CpsD/CapB family tyrosine-protein kinase [Acidobacteriota bacterium]
MPNLDSHLVSFTAPASFAAEQYQGLRLAVERMARTRDVKTIAISSPAAGDGKTVTAINLAGALARGADDRVLLIDADLRRPSVAKLLGLTDAERGLSDVLTDETLDVGDVVRSVDRPNLVILPAGSLRRGASETLRSARLDTLLRDLRQRYGCIVIDTPPLLPVFDSALLAKLVDGVLLVVAANQTPRKLLGESLNMLDPAKVLGIVFNRDERPLFGYYNSYSRYYRGYFANSSEVASRA